MGPGLAFCGPKRSLWKRACLSSLHVLQPRGGLPPVVPGALTTGLCVCTRCVSHMQRKHVHKATVYVPGWLHGGSVWWPCARCPGTCTGKLSVF